MPTSYRPYFCLIFLNIDHHFVIFQNLKCHHFITNFSRKKMDEKEDIILHIIVVGFHHKKGYQVSDSYKELSKIQFA